MHQRDSANLHSATQAISYHTSGEAISVADIQGVTTRTSYDALSRPTSRCYSTGQAGAEQQTCSQVGSNPSTETLESWSYDPANGIGQPLTYSLSVAGGTYPYSFRYDADNRPSAYTSASGAVIGRTYNAQGYLATILDGASGKTLWTANSRDAELHLTAATFGNGVYRQAGFYPANGKMYWLADSAAAGSPISFTHINYFWDQYENLTQRQDFDDYLTETFAYDDLNRLTSVSLPTGVENSFSYDLLGDMTSKADVGTYSFPAAGQAHPHGVASIAMAAGGTTTLAYDYDGQLTSETGPITRTIGWALFNKVASTAYAGLSTQCNYDADENVVDFIASGATVVTLPDGVVVTNGALRNWLIYAKVDGLKTVEFTGPTGALKHEYLHHDDQGSTLVVTDDTFNPATAQPQFSNAGRGGWPNSDSAISGNSA